MKTATLSSRTWTDRASTLAQPAGERMKPLQIRNVLVPVDFSDASLQAVDFACPLVRQFGANMHMVHLLESHFSPSTAAIPLMIPALEVARGIRRQLGEIAAKRGLKLPAGNIHYLEGRPFEKICSLARDTKMDLIVIATRGNTRFKHLVLGSTAERVVRFSPCPVLIVRGVRSGKRSTQPRNGSRAAGLKTIVVPIDFSDCSMKGLAFAKSLAKQFGAKLILLNSVDLHYPATSNEYARYDFGRLLEQSEKMLQQQMRDLIRSTDWEGISVEGRVEIGHAGDQICSRAKDHNADLIVTSTHGRSGLKHVLIGSTAEYVVRHAECPVLVVPSHERPEIKTTS